MRTSSALSDILTPRPYIPDPAFLAFCSARQVLNASLDNWLDTGPDPDFVAEEVRGSINAVRDIARLRGIVLR
jgi:hypothetical protein